MEPRHSTVLSWVLILLAILVLAPLLGMIAMMGLGSSAMVSSPIGGMMNGGMMAWGVVWMIVGAALLIGLIVALFRTINRT
jgi:uncharacterized membrane protein